MHAFHRTIIATILMLALQLVVLSSWAFAQQAIDVQDAVSTEASGINDAGVVVGTYTDSGRRNHGFRWEAGVVTHFIDVPGAVDTSVSGINDAGAVVGRYTDSSGTVHSFIIP